MKPINWYATFFLFSIKAAQFKRFLFKVFKAAQFKRLLFKAAQFKRVLFKVGQFKRVLFKAAQFKRVLFKVGWNGSIVQVVFQLWSTSSATHTWFQNTQNGSEDA